MAANAIDLIFIDSKNIYRIVSIQTVHDHGCRLPSHETNSACRFPACPWTPSGILDVTYTYEGRAGGPTGCLADHLLTTSSCARAGAQITAQPPPGAGPVGPCHADSGMALNLRGRKNAAHGPLCDFLGQALELPPFRPSFLNSCNKHIIFCKNTVI